MKNSAKEIKDRSNVTGIISISVIEKFTGKVLDYYSDDNVVTLEGLIELQQRMTVQDVPTIEDKVLNHIVLGDDVGSGDLLNPDPADELLEASDQSVVWGILPGDVSITYLSPKKMNFGTVLDGEDILNNNFPNEVDMRFTSATLRYKNDKALAYKRFPVRSLSRLVDIKIDWEITTDNGV